MQPHGICAEGHMVTKREGTTNRRGFLANGLSLAWAPCVSPRRRPPPLCRAFPLALDVPLTLQARADEMIE